MKLIKCLEKISSRQGGVFPNYRRINLEEFLSKHAVAIDIESYILPREITLFSRIQYGSVIEINRSELNITSLEVGNLRLQVQNV